MDESISKGLKGCLNAVCLFVCWFVHQPFHHGEYGEDNLIQAPHSIGKMQPKATDFLVFKDEKMKSPQNVIYCV